MMEFFIPTSMTDPAQGFYYCDCSPGWYFMLEEEVMPMIDYIIIDDVGFETDNGYACVLYHSCDEGYVQ